jgi:hypothetical protein
LAILLVYGLLADSNPGSQAVAQNAAKVEANSPRPKSGPNRYLGPGGCAPCHTLGKENVFGPKGLDFAAQTEANNIRFHDKHFKAYTLLLTDKEHPENELARRMEKKLKKWMGDDYKVTTDARCLACHADLHEKPGLEESVHLGVTCESCHGPSSNWETPHKQKGWRAASRHVKEELGFIDVRSPAKRAQMCFSCHIGNVDQEKVVTHEMYAVGHPPLPGVEIETFVSQMPTHWRTINEKGDFDNRLDWIKQNLGIEAKDVSTDLVKSKATLISGVVALRESVNLFVTGASKSEQWPDFAAFDCLACHHELKGDSWRQNRGYANGVPGRPLPYAWPTALVKLAIRQTTQENQADYEKKVLEFERHLRHVYSAALKSPFGAPEDMRKLGLNFDAAAPEGDPANLIEWLDKLANEVFKSKLDKVAAKIVLNEIVDLPTKDYPDFHSARQLIWAFRTISIEMRLKNYPKLEPGTSTKIAIENIESFDDWRSTGEGAIRSAIVDRELEELGFAKQFFSKELKLPPDSPPKYIILPAGQEHKIADYVSSSLQMISDFDQEEFRERLQTLKLMIDAK